MPAYALPAGDFTLNNQLWSVWSGWAGTDNVEQNTYLARMRNRFVLADGDIATSPPAGPTFPLMLHAVSKGTPYSWATRF